MNSMLIQLDDDSLDQVAGGGGRGHELVIDTGAILGGAVEAGSAIVHKTGELVAGAVGLVLEHLPTVKVKIGFGGHVG